MGHTETWWALAHGEFALVAHRRRYEIWLLAAAAPSLLFPGTWAPIALGAILLTWAARGILKYGFDQVGN